MKKQDLKSKVVEDLKDKILNFRLLPGVKISDHEIAKEMGISRTPVREALVQLAEQGLVESKYYHGFRVKLLSEQEIKDLYAVREVLEGLAVKLTTPRLDREKIKTLRELLNTYPEFIEKGDVAGFNSADELFHDLVARYSDNPFLLKNLRALHNQVRLSRRYAYMRSTGFEESYEEHKKILNFMIENESAKARQAMSRHILNSLKQLVIVLRQDNAWTRDVR